MNETLVVVLSLFLTFLVLLENIRPGYIFSFEYFAIHFSMYAINFITGGLSFCNFFWIGSGCSVGHAV